MIDGLVIGIQAWFDPYVGYFDYVHERRPTGPPQCQPKKKVPLYSADGTADPLYGQPPCFPGFETVANWERYSADILGCTGNRTATSRGPHDFPQGSHTDCYTFPSCPGITGAGLNVMCEVTGMTHDGSSLGVLLPRAFADFFGQEAALVEEGGREGGRLERPPVPHLEPPLEAHPAKLVWAHPGQLVAHPAQRPKEA